MKTKFILSIFGAALLAVGCVSTGDGRKTAAIPFIKDEVGGQYQRSLQQVYDAAKTVVARNGQIVSETMLHNTTNAVQAIEGRVNQRSIWVRVEAVEPRLTSIVVQARTRGGGRDLDLAHQLEKEVALELVNMR